MSNYCEHEYENANCVNCANGAPCSAYECAKTKGQLKEYVHKRADEIHRQKYNEGYERGYELGRADAIDECIKTIKGLCSGWRYGIVKVIIDKLEQLKEQTNDKI